VFKSLKSKQKKHEIDVSKAAPKALENEVKIREDAELLQAICKMKNILKKIPDEQIAKAIRESRDQR
jgi:hypothetical protein